MKERTDPGKGATIEEYVKYFEFLGFTHEEAEGMAPNWARTNPQMMEEVRNGILWERQNRTDSSEEWVSEIGQ